MKSIDVNAGRIELRVHFKHKDRAKSLGARWDAASRIWHLQATPPAAASVIAEFGDYDIGSAVSKLAAPMFEKSTSQLDKPIPLTRVGKEPWTKQRQAFNYTFDRFSASSSGGVLLDMAMGTGKSRVGIDVAQNMAARRVLIMGPKSAIAVWPFQVLRWAVNADDWHVVVLGDTPPDDTEEPLPKSWLFEHRSVERRAAALQQALMRQGDKRHLVVVVNWEGYWREPMAEQILDTRWDLAIGDEVHRIKAPRGEASLFASQLEQAAETANYRIGMSGTPMPHSPLDAFGVMRFVDRSLFGLSVTLFRRTYLFINPYIGGGRATTKNPLTGDWFADERARRAFEQRYGSVTFRAEKDLDSLPPLTSVYRWAELEPKARKHYAELMEEMFTLVRKTTRGLSPEDAEHAVATSPNAMVLVTRLQQILCGFIVDEDGVKHNVSDAKERLLAEVLQDIAPEEPVIVFARFVEDLDRIKAAAEKVGRRYGEVSGRRKDVKGALRASQGFDLVAVQVQSGSVGVDYTLANNVIFYSVWGGGDFAQARDRCHRPPQKNPVTMIALVTKPINGAMAVDARLMKSLYENEDALRAVARAAVQSVWKK